MLCHGETCNMPSGRFHTNEQRLQQPQGHERFGGFGTVSKKQTTCIDVSLDESQILKLPRSTKINSISLVNHCNFTPQPPLSKISFAQQDFKGATVAMS